MIASLALGCSHGLPHPPYVPQPQSALAQVTLPPPPGRVEQVPRRPSDSAVWIDGEWMWRRGRWAWLPGRWVQTPAGLAFSPSEIVRGADGRLWYAPGAWRDGTGASVEAPPPLAMANVGSTEVVNASGSTENTGPTLKRAKPDEGRR
jgi:hypothetical protein